MYTTPREAYLLTLTRPCRDLIFAQVIGLTATGHTVNARLDSVKVKGWRCPIPEIRTIGYARVRADMRAEADKVRSGG